MSDSLQPHSLPGSSVHGIFQARILEGVAICSSRDLPDPGIKPTFLASPALAGGFFFTVPPRNHTASSHFRGPKRGVGGLGRGSEEHTDDEVSAGSRLRPKTTKEDLAPASISSIVNSLNWNCV